MSRVAIDSQQAQRPPASSTPNNGIAHSHAEAYSCLWLAAEPPVLEAFLAQVGPLDPGALAAILEVDQRERWQRGEVVCTEVYLDSFPVLRGHTATFALILGEMYQRQASGHVIALDDFRRRFPDFREQLDLMDEFGGETFEESQLRTEQISPKPVAKNESSKSPVSMPEAVCTVRLRPDWAKSDDLSRDLPESDTSFERTVTQPRHVGPFEIVRVLAHGGMGVIYEAVDTRLHRQVALKMVLSGQHAEPEALARFRGEAMAVARLQHPNIVQVFEVSEHEGLPYLALEYVPGRNLQQLIAGKALPAYQAARLTQTLARTIEFAHQRGIIHRDLKPGNILISADGTPKITDFGLAKLHKAKVTYSRPGEVVGTPNYMAPEQADGSSTSVGPATDVYALGAVLFEMCTGQPPFAGCSPMETLMRLRLVEPMRPSLLTAGLPRDLETICLKCLRKNRHDRYSSAAELADDLERFLARKPIQARPVGVPERVWKWARRHPAAAFAGAVLFAMFLTAYGLVFFQWQAAEDARQEANRQNRDLLDARRLQRENLAKTQEAFDRQQRALYIQALANAELEWLTGDAARARQRLEECQPQQRGWEWAYLRRRVQGSQVTVTNPPDGPVALNVLPTGKEFVTLGAGGVLELRDLASGQLKAQIPLQRDVRFPDGGSFQSGVLSRDGTRLAAAYTLPLGLTKSPMGRVGVWDIANGKLVNSWASEAGVPLRLAFRPDGQRLAWTSGQRVERRGSRAWERGEIRVHDVLTGSPCLQIAASLDSYLDISFSPDGKHLALTSAKLPMMVCDAETGATLIRCPAPLLDGKQIIFSPDGQRLIVRCEDVVVQYSLNGNSRRVLTVLRGDLHDIFTSPDGRWLAVAEAGNSIRLYDTEGWIPVQHLVGHMSGVRLAAFSPDNQHLVSQSKDNSTKVWNLAAGREPLAFGKGDFKPGCWVPSAAFDKTGACVYVACDDKFIRVYDAATGRQLNRLPAVADSRALAVSPDGTKLAVGCDARQGHLALWDLTVTKEAVWPNAHHDSICCVAFNPDGTRLASASEDGTGKVWDLATGQMMFELLGHKSAVNWIAFRPDGKELITAGADGCIRAWAADDGTLIRTVHSHESPVTCAVFSPDGRWLASANSNRGLTGVGTHIKVWDAQTGELVRTFSGHDRSIWHLAFAPDGSRLASAGEDGTVKIWDPEYGELLLTLKGHSDDIRWVGFSPDSHRLISSGDDQFLRLWDGTPIPAK